MKILKSLASLIAVSLTICSCENTNDNEKGFNRANLIETYPLVAGYDYNQSLNSTATKYVTANFGGKEYTIEYQIFPKDGLVKEAASQIGVLDANGFFSRKSVPFDDFFNEFKIKYNFNEQSTVVSQLNQKLSEARSIQIQVKQKYIKGYRGSLEEENDLSNLKYHVGSFYFSSSNNMILVRCYCPEMGEGKSDSYWNVVSCVYYAQSDWIEDTKEYINNLNYMTNHIINENSGF
jgi:hypothetical protein